MGISVRRDTAWLPAGPRSNRNQALAYVDVYRAVEKGRENPTAIATRVQERSY
jgi:hypothetical protein